MSTNRSEKIADLLKKENLAVDYDGGTKTKKWG